MQVKKIYKPRASDSAPFEVDYLEVISNPSTQKFTQRFLDMGVTEGWLSIANGNFIIKTAPELEDVVYKVVRKPGHYCCHTDQPLADEHAARKHIADNYLGVESPDPQNPAGYRKDNFYLCELVEGE